MTEGRITRDEDGELVIATPLLERLDGIQREVAAGFARITEALSGKADKADVARMESRLESHAERIATIERWRNDREVAADVHRSRDSKLLTRKEKIWGVVAGVALFGATLLGPSIANWVH